MGKKSKAPPKVDTSSSTKYLEKYTPTSYRTDLGPLGGTSARFDPNTKRVTTGLDLDPRVSQMVSDALGGIEGIEGGIQAAGQEAYDANYAPIQRETQNTLRNLYMGGGGSNVRNSRVEDIMARSADQLAEQQGRRLFDVRRGGERDYLTEAAQLYNMRMNPYQMVLGQASPLTSLVGSGVSGAGRAGAGILSSAAGQSAQMQQQTNRDRMSGLGSLIGTGLGAISSLGAGMFSDRRLKENIKEVGKLKNGLKIYKYNYKGDTTPQIGAMAQEVEKKNPKAVSMHPAGYRMVNYEEAVR